MEVDPHSTAKFQFLVDLRVWGLLGTIFYMEIYRVGVLQFWWVCGGARCFESVLAGGKRGVGPAAVPELFCRLRIFVLAGSRFCGFWALSRVILGGGKLKGKSLFRHPQ